MLSLPRLNSPDSMYPFIMLTPSFWSKETPEISSKQTTSYSHMKRLTRNSFEVGALPPITARALRNPICEAVTFARAEWKDNFSREIKMSMAEAICCWEISSPGSETYQIASQNCCPNSLSWKYNSPSVRYRWKTTPLCRKTTEQPRQVVGLQAISTDPRIILAALFSCFR